MNKVLIVDDDQTLQLALSRRLQTQGFEVTLASSGQEALLLLDQAMPDIVVSDVVMPDMDGFEFCRSLRNKPNGQLVPFIFLSSLAEVNSRVEGHLMGADDYLVKPFHIQELIAKMKGLMIRAEQVHHEVERLVNAAQTKLLQASPPPAPLPLTPAEEKVFWEAVQGFTNKQIGERLFLSPRTVQTHLSNILTKLALSNRAQLVRFAFEHGYQLPIDETAD